MSVPSFLFQSPDFIFRNTQTEVVSFRSQNGISIYFTQVGHCLVSGARSPFGSFVISESADIKPLRGLIEEVVRYGKEHNIESIEIKCYPEVYAPQPAAIINDALKELGFYLKYKDITQILFAHQMVDLYPDRRRKVKECVANEYKFKQLGIESLPAAYDLFLASRNSKGYPMTMKLMDFFDEFNKFPSHYKLYGVLDGDILIAACVVVLINNEIIYYFFSGDNLAYRKHSPTTYLIFNLHQVALKSGFKFIDMGISTDKGVLNQGLYNFKKSFGAVDSLKLTFEKKL